MKFEWEKLDGNTHRVKVHGGWIVTTESELFDVLHEKAIAAVFVPDPNHEWIIEKK